MGQVVGFLGPSGIGKTKLFEVLAGLLEPTSGKVTINNPAIPVKAGLVGVVQQNYPLFNHRTVYGNLDVAAKKTCKDAAERKKKIDDILNINESYVFFKVADQGATGALNTILTPK